MPPHGHHHGTHQQGRGQVIRQGRDKEGQNASDPEYLAQRKATSNQPGSQGREHLTFIHGIYIHRREQEEHQFGKFEQIMPNGGGGVGITVHGIGDAHHKPDDPCGDNNRLGFA